MKRLTLYGLALMVFWFMLFFVNRLFFVAYQISFGHKIMGSSDLWKSIYKGYPLDLSVGAMLALLPSLLGVLYFVFRKEYFKKFALATVFFFMLLYVAVCLADAGLYKEWNAKINMQALEHFRHPSEVFKTLSTKLLLLFVVFLTLIIWPFYLLYKNKVSPILQFPIQPLHKMRVVAGVLFFMISTTLGVFAIRGGVTNIPINQSIAYFSKYPFANDIAVNPLYSLLQDFDIKSKLPDSSIYKLRTNAEAQQWIASDYTVIKDTTIEIFNSTKPNIVYIFLEGWSADNIGILGGIKDCTPQFDKLCQEGLLFSKAYADAYVSDQGIVAGLSAFPSAHRMAIANQPTKVHKLPCIVDHLIPLGYHPSFLFGGELVYGNLRGYLLEKQFADLKEVYDLSQYPKGKLGVHDEYTFKELLSILNNNKQPFFQGYFTSSTHMPYDFQKSDDWESTKEDVEKEYTESMHYADIHLGKFFAEAKKQAWYNSTIFIVVSDHSHNSIKQWDPMSSMRQHIPMLFVGGALKQEWKGKQIEKIVSQLDIVSTVLHQMKISSERFPWSRNMMNPYTSSSAFYVYFGGAGYVTDSGFAASSYHNLKYTCSNLLDTTLIEKYKNKALSFQQLVFENVRLRK